MSKLQVALTIAGTDPSGGAGIMADLKSFSSAWGLWYGCCYQRCGTKYPRCASHL